MTIEKEKINFDDLISEIIKTEKKLEFANPEEELFLKQKLENLHSKVKEITSRLEKIENYLEIDNSKKDSSTTFIKNEEKKEIEMMKVNEIITSNISNKTISINKEEVFFNEGVYAYILLAYLERKSNIKLQILAYLISFVSIVIYFAYSSNTLDLLTGFKMFTALLMSVVVINLISEKKLNESEKKGFEKLANVLKVRFFDSRHELELARYKILGKNKPLSYYVNLLNIANIKEEKNIEKLIPIEEAVLNVGVEKKLFEILGIKSEEEIENEKRKADKL